MSGEPAKIPAEEACLCNRCTVNEQVLRRSFWLAGRAARIIILSGCAVLLLAILLPLLWRGTPHYLLLLLIAAEVALIFWMPYQNAKLTMRRIREARGVEVYEECVRCLPDALLGQASFSQDTVRIRYEDIKKVRTHGGLMQVVTRANQILLLDAARFENGTLADFRRLLAEKCPKVRLPF